VTGRVEVVGYRDPDGGTEIVVFVDGQKVAVDDETVVDPGSTARTLAEWNDSRDEAQARASFAAAEQIHEFYELGAETQFIRPE
jgi:hypothetical protein